VSGGPRDLYIEKLARKFRWRVDAALRGDRHITYDYVKTMGPRGFEGVTFELHGCWGWENIETFSCSAYEKIPKKLLRLVKL
jgi:hypothetical protein